MTDRRPDFLNGVFIWGRSGYQLARDPEMDLLDERALQDPNPWIRLAAVLERAKAGDFRTLHLLIRELRNINNPVFPNAYVLLLGQAGSPSCIRQVLEEFRNEVFVQRDWVLQEHVAFILQESLLLWTIPVMLDIFLNTIRREDSIIIPHLFSEMMESERGPIYEVEVPDVEFKELVLGRYGELVAQLGSDQVPVLYGKLFSVKRAAERLYECLTSPAWRPQVRRERAVFEAATGIDCRAFYKDGDLKPLAAAAIVEEFLEGEYATRFEPGFRYFFGHRIPD